MRYLSALNINLMEKKMLKKVLGLVLTISIVTPSAFARDQINIVGSSTVYPFAIVVAEKFGKTSDYKTPKIESTGSGGGLKATLLVSDLADGKKLVFISLSTLPVGFGARATVRFKRSLPFFKR